MIGTEFKKKIEDRFPMPEKRPAGELDRFGRENKGKYPVEWIDSVPLHKA